MVVLQIIAALLFTASAAYLILALFRIERFGRAPAVRGARPAVTVMVPCFGAPPSLERCLSSICDQVYEGPIQVVFGLHSADDPARAVIEEIVARRPALDASVVVDSNRIGANPKNCNLANMMAAVRHDVMVMVDSDVLVTPGFVAAIVAPFQEPGVGCVTSLYKGLPEAGLASHLGALYINDWFIPSALVDLARHDIDLTYGAATAITRAALDSVGGFAAMASAVAQDYVLGHEIRRAGFGIRLASEVVGTIVDDSDLAHLYRHEIRWMRAIRAVRPTDHLLWIVTSSLIPLILLSWVWPVAVAMTALAFYLGLRFLLHYRLRQHIGLPVPEPLLLPLRELVNFALWTGSFFGRRVCWGDNVLITGDGLAMHAAGTGREGRSAADIGAFKCN